MRIAELIGSVTISRGHPSLDAAAWKIGVPLSRDGLTNETAGRGEPFVIYDELNAAVGEHIAVSEGAEASAPFHPNQKPIDAYNAAILDHVNVSE